MNLDVLESTTIQATIQDLVSSAPAALLYGDGKVKAHQDAVPEGIPLPYVVYNHISGGWMNNSQRDHSESIYRITVVTSDWENLDVYSNFIAQLHRKMPIVATPVQAFHYFEEITPISSRKVVQQVSVFEKGGLYRLKLSYVY